VQLAGDDVAKVLVWFPVESHAPHAEYVNEVQVAGGADVSAARKLA
jgi:hypothetical protein